MPGHRSPDEEAIPVRSLSERLLQGARVALYITLYLFCGPALILTNNKILRAHKFPYPMAISALGLVSTWAVSATLVGGRCETLEQREHITRQFFVRNLLPVGATLATTYACGNAVYLYLPVGFIQMLKVLLTWPCRCS